LDREVVIEAHWWKGAKRFKVNGVPQTRLSDILGRIHVVFFSPEDMDLVQGAAAGRRRLLDMALAQLEAPYLTALQSYRQALRQRNELLRAAAPDGVQLDVWDAQLAQHGREVVLRRAAYLEALAGHAQMAYGAIADAERFEAVYAPDIGPEEDFVGVLQRQRGSDLKYRVTGRGPHRDDVVFRIGDRAARVYASHGQQKTAVLAMKLGMLQLVRERIGEYPVLLLDEVLAELDAERSRRLFAVLPEGVQCIVTTTDRYAREQWFGKEATHFVVEAGGIRPG
jgi:DNA replication and repair protein RecF